MRDRFDKIILALLVVILACSVVLLTGAAPGGSERDASMSRKLEREIAYQARVSFLERHYQPVLELRDQGALQEA